MCPWGSLAVHGHSTTPTMSAVLRLRREPPRCTARARLPLRGRKREALASVSAAHNMRHYARYTSGLLHQMPATAPPFAAVTSRKELANLRTSKRDHVKQLAIFSNYLIVVLNFIPNDIKQLKYIIGGIHKKHIL